MTINKTNSTANTDFSYNRMRVEPDFSTMSAWQVLLKSFLNKNRMLQNWFLSKRFINHIADFWIKPSLKN